MSRRLKLWQVALLGLVIGCGESSLPAKASRDAAPEMSETTVSSESPDLTAAPSDAAPAMNSAALAADIFTSIVQAAVSGDAGAWTKAEGELNELGLIAVPVLAERLSDKNRVARELAAMFLAQLGPDASPAAAGLLNLLEDESTFARVNAAAAISTFEGYAERVAPVLTALLADDDVNVRITAATSLRNVGESASGSVDLLTRALLDADSRVRTAAAVTLGELGPRASPSLLTLRKLADDEDDQVRTAADRAIRRIDETARTKPVTIPASATE